MAFELDLNVLYEGMIVILILLVTYIVGKIASKVIKETFKKAGIPETEIIFVASAVGYSIYLVGILIALGRIGIDVIYFWITLAAGGIVLGIAARSSITDLVSGYFLRVYGPFDVGDVIKIEGKIGLLKDLTLLRTTIETSDHLVYSIANSEVMRSQIYNFTRYKSDFPVEFSVEISREADINNVKLKILQIIKSYPKTKFEKPVQIYIEDFTEKGTLLNVLFYVPDFQLIQGAKDFVTSGILDVAKAGKISLVPINQGL